MGAYKTLRTQGFQPRAIDGCADVAVQAHSQTEIEMGQTIPKDKLEVAEQVASEFLGRDVTAEGKKIGAAKREVA